MPLDHFDEWAITYDKSITQRLFFGPIQKAMLDIIQKSATIASPVAILDVGCGTGRLLRSAGRRWPQAKLTGVDFSKQMIAEASRLLPSAQWFAAPAEQLPIQDASVDLALSSLSLHHWSDQAKGLSEIARVLRPGGFFCLADQTMPRWLARLADSKSFTAQGLRDALRQAGFSELRREFRYGWIISIILAQKPM
jgi:ubiquinone/menaquinone biosynthesis C-methylase UbiE